MAITAEFGTVEYFGDLIKVPISFGSGIVVLEPSDFDIKNVEELLDCYVLGDDAAFDLFILPKEDLSGTATIELSGRVFGSDAASLSDKQNIVAPILLVPYNTIEPRIVARRLPSLLPGTQSVYLDLNRDVLGITANSFIISGIEVGLPKLYAAPKPDTDLPTGSRPISSEYVEYDNSEEPRRYFRLDFEFPNPPPTGSLNIRLKQGAAIGYVDKSASPVIPEMNLSFTVGQEFSQIYKIAAVGILDGITISGLPIGITGVISNNVITISGTPTTVGIGTASINNIPIGDGLTASQARPWVVSSAPQPQMQANVPVLTLVEPQTHVTNGKVELIKGEGFNIEATITGSPTKTYVEGLLRNWTFLDSVSTLDILGSAEDVTRLEEGVWRVIMQYNFQEQIPATPDASWSNTIAGNFFISANHGADLGTPPDASGITRHEMFTGSIGYRIPETGDYSQLSVSHDFRFTRQGRVICRHGPTLPQQLSEVNTIGTILFNHAGGNNVISNALGTLADPDSGEYFWIYSVADEFYTHRDIDVILTGTMGGLGPVEQREEVANINWSVIERQPIVESVGMKRVYMDHPIRIPVAIQNSPAGVSAKGLLAQMYHQRVLGESDVEGIIGVEIRGVPDRLVGVEEQRMVMIDASNTGGDDDGDFQLEVVSGTPPPMSTVTFTIGMEQATFTWEAVEGAESYAYRIGSEEEDDWVDIGNVTSHTIQELLGDITYPIYWRVNSPYLSDAFGPLEVRTGTSAYVFYENKRDLYKVNQVGNLEWSYDALSGTFGANHIVLDEEKDVYINQIDSRTAHKISRGGELLWSHTYTTSSTGFSDPLIDSDGNLILYASGNIIKINGSNGSLIYRNTNAPRSVQGVFPYRAILDNNNDIILYNIISGNLSKYNKTNGNQIWDNTTIPIISGAGIKYSKPVIDGENNIIITDIRNTGTASGHIYKVNDATGSLDWTHTMASRGNGVSESLINSANDVYVISKSDVNTNFLHKISSLGVQLWALQIPPNSPVAYDPLLIDSDENIICIDRSTSKHITKVSPLGAQLWTKQEIGSETNPFLLDFDDNIYIVKVDNRSNNEYAVRKIDTNGQVVWTIPAGSPVPELQTDDGLDTFDQESYLLRDGSLYLFSNGFKRLYRVSKDGSISWVFEGFRTLNASGNFRVYV